MVVVELGTLAQLSLNELTASVEYGLDGTQRPIIMLLLGQQLLHELEQGHDLACKLTSVLEAL